jgi:hypothetical protein
MTTQPKQPVEADERYPSGAWTGFFMQPPTARQWMQLTLTFRSGTLRGDGHDCVGPFAINGGYDLKEGRCWWTKRYLGQHAVKYSGYNEGKGIWGVWDIRHALSGGFHIWPAGMDDPTAEALAAHKERPAAADAVSRRTHVTPVGRVDPPRQHLHPLEDPHAGSAR